MRHLSEIFRPLGRIAEKIIPEEIPLARLSPEQRSKIWSAPDPEQLWNTIEEINRGLLESGNRPLSYREINDAEQGNLVKRQQVQLQKQK